MERKSTSASLLMGLILIVVVIGLQIFAWNFHDRFIDQFMLLETGRQPAIMALISSALFIVSGGVFALLIFSPLPEKASNSVGGQYSVPILLGLSFLAVLMKFLTGAIGVQVFPYHILRPFLLDLTQWIIYSEVPAFMIGLGIGRLILKRRK